MVPLGNSGIYCRKVFYRYALGACKATFFARRLIPGIFHPDAIKHGTISGQESRSLPHDDDQEETEVLHKKAIITIVG